MVKKCPVCGAEVADDAQNCPKCGADLSKMEFEEEEEVELEKLLEDLGEEFEEEEVELPEIEDIGKEEDLLGEIESIVEGTEAEGEDVLPDIDDLGTIETLPGEGEERALEEIEELVAEEKIEETPSEEAGIEEITEVSEKVSEEVSEAGEEVVEAQPEMAEIEAPVEEKVTSPSEEEIKAEEMPVEKAEIAEVSVAEEEVVEAQPEVVEGEAPAEEKVIPPSEEAIKPEEVPVVEEEIKAEEMPPEKAEIAEVSEEAGGEVSVVGEEVVEAKPEVGEEAPAEEVVEEKVEEEVVEEYVCPICGRDIPPDAEECPYCGVVFGLEISVEEVLKNLLQYIKQLVVFAKEMGVDTVEAMKYVKEAWGLASKDEYEEGVKRLVDARILLEHELSTKLNRELDKYRKYLSSDAVKIVYDRVKRLLEARKFKEAFEEMERLKEVSRPMKIKAKKTFKKLKEMSETLKIAKRFGIEVEDIENLLNRAKKDFSEGKFNDAIKKADTAAKRLEGRVEESLKPILISIKNYMFAAQVKGIDTKPILAKVREFKYASEEKNVKEMLRVLQEINSLLKEWGLVR